MTTEDKIEEEYKNFLKDLHSLHDKCADAKEFYERVGVIFDMYQRSGLYLSVFLYIAITFMQEMEEISIKDMLH
jgi:hypothetical protein